jgi:transposase-like protein
MDDDSSPSTAAGRPPGPGGHITPQARARLRDAYWLRTRLHEDGVSVRALAVELGAAQATVSYWLAQHGIRPLGAVERIERTVRATLREIASPEANEPSRWLRNRVGRGWSWQQLTDEIDRAASPGQLKRLAATQGINASHVGGRPVPAQARERLDDPTWLQRRYHDDGATLRDVALELGMHMRTVERAMRRADISRRRRGRRPHPQGCPQSGAGAPRPACWTCSSERWGCVRLSCWPMPATSPRATSGRYGCTKRLSPCDPPGG